MIRFWRIYIYVACLLCVASASAQTVYLPNYSAKNGLPSNNCYYALQDQKNFIWIATESGVSRFDGKNFENFSVDDGLPDNQIVQLHEDKKGRIWFLSLNGKLSYFYNGIIYNAKIDKNLAKLDLNAIVVSFFEDKQGEIWLGTNKNYIAHWNGKQLQKIAPSSAQTLFYNSFLTSDQQGRPLAINTSGAYAWDGKKFVQQPAADLPVSYKAIVKTDSLLAFVSKKGWTTILNQQQQLTELLPKSVDLNSLGYIFATKTQLWLPTANGVFVYDKNKQVQHLLSGHSINHIFKDKQGNTWFTTNTGIYKMPAPSQRLYIVNEKAGLAQNQVKSLAQPNSKTLWLGLANGSLTKLSFNPLRIENLQLGNNIGPIKQISFHKNLLYFSSEHALGFFDSQASTPKPKFLKELHQAQFVVKNFSIGSKNQLAVSFSSGTALIDIKKGLAFEANSTNKNNLFVPNRSYRVFVDQKDSLWLADINGLQKIENGLPKIIGENSDILRQRITDIQQLQPHILALATDGYGIAILKNQKLVLRITRKNGLNSNIINKLFVHKNTLWAVGNKGINKIDFDGNLKAQVSSFNNDLLVTDVNDLTINRDSAYFATNHGLVYFNYTANTDTLPPKAYITSVVANGKLLDLTEPSYRFAPGNNKFVVNFSAVDFCGSDITYRYRLTPNSDWQETRANKIDLQALEPGKYQIEIQAKNGNGNWGISSIIYLQLDSYFWQTNLFWGAIILLCAFLIYKGAVYITKKQKNREQEQLLLKNKILVLEQRALQAMMNPHFVFNVMNAIQHHINIQNTASANKILTGFAKLIRKNLDIVTKSYITLAEEIDYLKLYLNLEKQRFGSKLSYELIIDTGLDLEDILIPSMLLQPFVENAIWHGIMPKEDGGNICIELMPNDNAYLSITITDDGIGIDNAAKMKKEGHQSKGMTLTTDRIALLNKIDDRPIQFSVQQNGKSGTTVRLRLPI